MKIIAFVGFLFVVGTSCVPTPNQVRLAIERAKAINTLKRELNTLEARNVDSQKASGCPALARFHGRRSNTDIEQDREATDLMLATRLLLNDGFTHEDLQHESVVAEFSRQTTNSGCSPSFAACDSNAAYRTADGSCNNLQNPTFGMAGAPQRRVLTPVYNDDVGSPRSVGIDGEDLPNARNISNNVHIGGEDEIRSPNITLHTFQMGQFLDHDIIATPIQKEVSNCCNSPNDTQNCININIEEDDPFNPIFKQGYCMAVGRSAPVFCPDATSTTSRRQQINEITSFIDASNVYGSSDKEQAALRDGAFLKTEGNTRLPNNPNQTVCHANNEAEQFCSLAGDHRVNVVPSLTAYHNLFMLEHNRIAKLLESSFPDDEETLFQETRKIIIAIMQKIVYDEFLPTFLSSTALSKYKLLSSESFTYDPTLDPTVSNSFGIAYRMGHTWIPRDMSIFNQGLKSVQRLETDDTYENPELTYATRKPSGMEGLAYWLSGANSPETDRIVEEQARSRLFIDRDNNIAFDLVALNIQRGRDHGLPSYNEFRKACQLPSASDWESLVDHDNDTITRLQDAGYQSPEDIDLFTGSLTETANGSVVGPTLECILGDQFMRLKFADRFWYQGEAAGLNDAQQSAIRNYTMSKILCENYNFNKIHNPSAFEATDDITRCRLIPALNIDVFKPRSTTTTNASNRSGQRSRSRTVEKMIEELLHVLEEQEEEEN